jgi:hypothetical protein
MCFQSTNYVKSVVNIIFEVVFLKDYVSVN